MPKPRKVSVASRRLRPAVFSICWLRKGTANNLMCEGNWELGVGRLPPAAHGSYSTRTPQPFLPSQDTGSSLSAGTISSSSGFHVQHTLEPVQGQPHPNRSSMSITHVWA